MNPLNFMPEEKTAKFILDLSQHIQDLRYYFIKFAPKGDSNNVQTLAIDEILNKAFLHAMTHYNSSKGELDKYLKSLARGSMQEAGNDALRNHADIDASFVKDDIDSMLVQSALYKYALEQESLENTVVDKVFYETYDRQDLVRLSLTYINEFVAMCNALVTRNTTKVYSDAFVQECMSLMNTHPTFYDDCMYLYDTFGSQYEWFINVANDKEGIWKEADYTLLTTKESKRIRLLNEQTEQDVEDADVEPFFIYGNIGKKRIYRVYYAPLWESLCDKIDSKEINELKFIIGNDYLVRTPGNSCALLNTDLYGLYDLIRDEIVTNMVFKYDARLIHVGSESIYLLVNATIDNYPNTIVRANGIDINLNAQDVTDDLMIIGLGELDG